MSELSQADQALISPDYWQGINIMNPEHFAVAPEMHPVLTKKEDRVAAHALSSCLEQVLEGNSTELRTFHRPFNPTRDQMPDGSVIAIENEQLLLRAPVSVTRLPELSSSSLPESDLAPPFASYWREHQPTVVGDYFGEDTRVFGNADEDVYIGYGRWVTWGVLLSRKNGERLLSTNALVAARANEAGIVTVPAGGRWEGYRMGTLLPLEVGQANAHPEALLPGDCTSRMIVRVKDVREVRPGAGRLETEPSVLERLKDFARGLGGAVVPNPSLLETN